MNQGTWRGVCWMALTVVLVPSGLLAGGIGQGAVVIREGAKLYDDDHSSDFDRELSWGELVVGAEVEMFGEFRYGRFDMDEGRLRVTWIARERREFAHGWMDPEDLARFDYECCRFECVPFAGFKGGWDSCFLEAAEAKLSSLRAPAGTSDPPPPPAPPPPVVPVAPLPAAVPAGGAEAGERPLGNTDVLALAAAGVGDEVVIAKIRQAPVERLDVSTEAILELRRQGLSSAVIQAMLARAGSRP